MATQPNPSPADQINQAAERLVSLNEKALERTKKAQTALLDSYEKAVLKIVDSYEKTASTGDVEWIGAIASTQAELGRELTKAYVNVARDLVAQ
jgi:hypothetical protein